MREASFAPLDYPGVAPRRSWLLDLDGRVSWMEETEAVPEPWWDERFAVLAIGSNRRPERLAEHVRRADERLVAGVRVTLKGADVVYPSHVASYGVCTATIVACEAALVAGWLLLVTRAQLACLAKGERLGRLFDLFRLSGVTAELRDDSRRVITPLAFVHRHGPLRFADGRPRRLLRVHAYRSPIRGASLASAHRRVADLVDDPALNWPLDPAIAAHVDRRLAQCGLPQGWPEADRRSCGNELFGLGSPA